MQYKVPQNVDMEDRVIGPLSLRQFMFILIGAGVVLFLNFILVGFLRPIFYLLALVIAGLSLVIAFADYGGQKFEDFLVSAWQTISRPRSRIWKKYEEIPQEVRAKKAKGPSEFTTKPKESLAEARDDLERLAELVDSGGYVDISKKDRNISSISPSGLLNDEGAKDLIRGAEAANPELDNHIEAANKSVKPKEPLVSEVAKVSPDKKFRYPTIETKS